MDDPQEPRPAPLLEVARNDAGPSPERRMARREREEATVQPLWTTFRDTGDEDLRNRLVLHYAPLVKYVAGRVASGMPNTVERADLVSEGTIGLMDAIDKFEPARGLRFQSYAVVRIRGAMIDFLRSTDWVPRSVRAQIGEIQRAQVTVHSRLGRSATDPELAEELGISVRDLSRLYSKASYTNVTSVEEFGIGELLHGSEDSEPSVDREVLMSAIHGLAERDRAVVALYYFEGLTLTDIGRILGVTESRVSQLKTRATLSLRAALIVHGHEEGSTPHAR
jgi:RNA polymerase sigma factor for flagellar operon FliA